MNPQALPQAMPETHIAQPGGDMIPSLPTAETAPAAPETAPPLSAPMPALQQQAPATVASTLAASAPQAIPNNAALGTAAAPAVADDLDLIEKEWVDKAKAIVAQTRTDPYAQNKEMNRFKADYLQKRYNKNIKVEP